MGINKVQLLRKTPLLTLTMGKSSDDGAKAAKAGLCACGICCALCIGIPLLIIIIIIIIIVVVGSAADDITSADSWANAANQISCDNTTESADSTCSSAL